jgi:hypothetical protein
VKLLLDWGINIDAADKVSEEKRRERRREQKGRERRREERRGEERRGENRIEKNSTEEKRRDKIREVTLYSQLGYKIRPYHTVRYYIMHVRY